MITLYTRTDLRRESELKMINEIEFSDFRFSKEPFMQAEMVVFFDDDGQFRILKNRYNIYDPRTRELLNLVGIKILTDKNIAHD
jgi:hypothetical protein